MTTWIVPVIVCSILLVGLFKKVDLMDSFVRGAKDGLLTARNILPPLILLMTVIGMLRASGAIAQIASWVSPMFSAIGVPSEVVPLAMIRPLSGSGALAVLEDTLTQYGPDSIAGRTASVMMSATETTFYTAAVYFGAAKIKKTAHTIPCALTGDLFGMCMSAWIVLLLFS